MSSVRLIQSTRTASRNWSHLLENRFALRYIEGKGKGFPYSIPSVGPRADPGVQAVSPQVTVSHPPGGRLPLLFARPAVTSPATEHHRPLAGTKLYCFVTDAHRCEQLAQGCYAALPRDWTRDLLIASLTLYLLRHCASLHYITLALFRGIASSSIAIRQTVAVRWCLMWLRKWVYNCWRRFYISVCCYHICTSSAVYKTIGHWSNLTTGRITTAPGRFSRITAIIKNELYCCLLQME